MATVQQALPGTSTPTTGALMESQNGAMVGYPAAQANQLNSSALQLLQRSLPGLIVVVTLFALLLFYNWLDSGDYRPLYPNLPESEKSEAFNLLAGSALPARLDDRTGDIMVPADRYYEARMILANAGFADPGTTQSLDIFNEQSSLTTSQFMEEAQYRATTEIELSKSIVQISSIKSARVHLAAPRQSSYVRNRVPAKASVVVIAHPGRVITQANVQSITNLVSSSVPYLAVEDVSVVDQQGNLLTIAMSPALRMADEQTAYERSIESDYKSRIEQLLAPIVGIENVNSDVDVMIDFSELETTSEIYDEAGRGPISRSEIVSIDRSSGNFGASGIPGSQSNIPPIDTAIVDPAAEVTEIDAPTAPAEPTSERTTRNYELDRSIRYSRTAVGTITKLSVAVVINQRVLNVTGDGTEGEESAINIDQLSDLVRNSIGFDEARGDQVLVVSSPFMELAQIEEIPTPWYENASLIFIAKIVGGVIVFALAILFVVRPALTSLLSKNDKGANAGTNAGSLGGPLSPGLPFQQYGYDERIGLVRQAANTDSAKVANAIREMVRS